MLIPSHSQISFKNYLIPYLIATSFFMWPCVKVWGLRVLWINCFVMLFHWITAFINYMKDFFFCFYELNNIIIILICIWKILLVMTFTMERFFFNIVIAQNLHFFGFLISFKNTQHSSVNSHMCYITLSVYVIFFFLLIFIISFNCIWKNENWTFVMRI